MFARAARARPRKANAGALFCRGAAQSAAFYAAQRQNAALVTIARR